MPHDRNGHEIKLGDIIKAVPYNLSKKDSVDINGFDDKVRVGVVVEIRADEQECTGRFVYFVRDKTDRLKITTSIDYFGAKDAILHATPENYLEHITGWGSTIDWISR